MFALDSNNSKKEEVQKEEKEADVVIALEECVVFSTHRLGHENHDCSRL